MSDQPNNAVTKTEIRLVQQSFEAIKPSADELSATFYNKLFSDHPELRSMFPESMGEQRKKLMQTLAVAVVGLNKPETIIGAVQDLGRRHAGYNVLPVHYDYVGDALLHALGEHLPSDLADQRSAILAAWAEIYGLLSSTMLSAAGTESAGPVEEASDSGELPGALPTASEVSEPGVSEELATAEPERPGSPDQSSIFSLSPATDFNLDDPFQQSVKNILDQNSVRVRSVRSSRSILEFQVAEDQIDLATRALGMMSLRARPVVGNEIGWLYISR